MSTKLKLKKKDFCSYCVLLCHGSILLDLTLHHFPTILHSVLSNAVFEDLQKMYFTN